MIGGPRHEAMGSATLARFHIVSIFSLLGEIPDDRVDAVEAKLQEALQEALKAAGRPVEEAL